MVLTLCKWFLIELAQKIAERDCDSSVSIPIYEEDETELQVVCEFNLQLHYGEREDNTGWRNVDTIDFCVTNMYVACNDEPLDISVDWDESMLNEFVSDNIYD
jgi:hypothetical protein